MAKVCPPLPVRLVTHKSQQNDLLLRMVAPIAFLAQHASVLYPLKHWRADWAGGW